MQKIFWKDFDKYILTKRFVYLFVTNNSAHLVPIDALSKDEKLFLIQTIKSKIRKQTLGCLFYIVICFILFFVLVGVVQYLSVNLS
ncbi:YcxB family protein [Paenibacillus sp. CCS19]|uniref:YcxB family protein n=1 Tax=Paenibacillus sp. CCS19 TaxID=3158387 RepID=UPI003312FD75